ncbi:hypothetical protein [Parabacteroides sp. PF5-6]|uniref:hypothetical protein n=1 Tax=Parabacteroides sp. PF5-6 TaxID=1742403 RepID=UPI003217DA64
MNFIKKGLLNSDYGRLFSRLFEMRQSGDYDDMFDFTEEEVRPYFDKVRSMLQAMEELLSFKSQS